MWCLSLYFFVCHAPSPEHRAFEGCLFRTFVDFKFGADQNVDVQLRCRL